MEFQIIFKLFCFQAYTIDSRCLEALLLKGTALLELKRHQEVLQHFREALRVAPHRYEAHKGTSIQTCSRYNVSFGCKVFRVTKEKKTWS